MTEVNEPRGAELIPASQAAHPARDPNSSHISALQSRVATDLGMLAAHGAEDGPAGVSNSACGHGARRSRGCAVDPSTSSAGCMTRHASARGSAAISRPTECNAPSGRCSHERSHVFSERIIAAAQAANEGILSKRELESS